MRKIDPKELFWRSNDSWWSVDEDTLLDIIFEDAPPEAIENYKQYMRNRGFSEDEIKVMPRSYQFEVDAIYEKVNNQEKQVFCPRCGKELLIEKRDKQIFVVCQTTGCLFQAFKDYSLCRT